MVSSTANAAPAVALQCKATVTPAEATPISGSDVSKMYGQCAISLAESLRRVRAASRHNAAKTGIPHACPNQGTSSEPATSRVSSGTLPICAWSNRDVING